MSDQHSTPPEQEGARLSTDASNTWPLEAQARDHRRYLVYQQHHHCREEVYLYTTHAIIAGPFENEARALAEARRRWKRGRRCYVREIGDTSGLSPDPLPACTCCAQAPDPGCLFGTYLAGRAGALEEMMQHPGFAHLTAGLQRQVAKQQERWQRKYLLHFLPRGNATNPQQASHSARLTCCGERGKA